MLKRTHSLALMTAVLVVPFFAGTTQADFVTYTVTDAAAQRTTDFQVSLSVPAFDRTLGTLQDIVFSMTDSGTFRGSLKNNSATAQSFLVTEAIHLSLTTGTTAILSDDLFAQQSYNLLATKASASFGAYNPSNSVGPVTFASGAVFNQFQSATTPVVLDFSTLTKTVTRGGGGNLSTGIFTTAGATFTIRYDYLPAALPPPVTPRINGVPEPASLAMTALGGMIAAGVGLARRRSRKSAA